MEIQSTQKNLFPSPPLAEYSIGSFIFRYCIYFIDIECNESNLMVLKCHKFWAEWTCDFNFSDLERIQKGGKKKKKGWKNVYLWFQLWQSICPGIINQSNLFESIFTLNSNWFNSSDLWYCALTQWANCHQITQIKLPFIFIKWIVSPLSQLTVLIFG